MTTSEIKNLRDYILPRLRSAMTCAEIVGNAKIVGELLEISAFLNRLKTPIDKALSDIEQQERLDEIFTSHESHEPPEFPEREYDEWVEEKHG